MDQKREDYAEPDAGPLVRLPRAAVGCALLLAGIGFALLGRWTGGPAGWSDLFFLACLIGGGILLISDAHAPPAV
jgi:hypothetical protein